MVERLSLMDDGLEPAAMGDFVRYSDYAALEKQVEELRAELARRDMQLEAAAKVALQLGERADEASAREAKLLELIEPFAMTPYANDGLGDERQEICAGINLGHLRAARSILSAPPSSALSELRARILKEAADVARAAKGKPFGKEPYQRLAATGHDIATAILNIGKGE